jgi:hypothetical protein
MNQDRIPRSAMPSIDLMVLVCGVVLFGCAGRLDIIAFWCWLAELAAICVATILIIEPDLVRERMRPGRQRLSRLLAEHAVVCGGPRGGGVGSWPAALVG